MVDAMKPLLVERERERENNSINDKKMDVYLAGSYSRPFVHEEIKNDQNMQIYLAGGATGNNVKIWKDNAKQIQQNQWKYF